CSGRKANVRVRGSLPPRTDGACRRRRIVEAVRGQRLLAARDAGEDRDAEVGVADRSVGEGRSGRDALHRRDGPVRERVLKVFISGYAAPGGLRESGLPDRLTCPNSAFPQVNRYPQVVLIPLASRR